MNSGLDSLGKLVNNINSQKRELEYPFPPSISRDWNSCSTFQGSSMMLLPVWLEGALATRSPTGIFTPMTLFLSQGAPATMKPDYAWLPRLTVLCKAFAQAVYSPSSSYPANSQTFFKIQLEGHCCEFSLTSQTQFAGFRLVFPLHWIRFVLVLFVYVFPK